MKNSEVVNLNGAQWLKSENQNDLIYDCNIYVVILRNTIYGDNLSSFMEPAENQRYLLTMIMTSRSVF